MVTVPGSPTSARCCVATLPLPATVVRGVGRQGDRQRTLGYGVHRELVDGNVRVERGQQPQLPGRAVRDLEVPCRQTGHRFRKPHQHRHPVVRTYEAGRRDGHRRLRADAVYRAPGVGRTLAGMAQLGLGLVADALDAAAVALQAVGDDVEPVGVPVAVHHDVAEPESHGPVTGAVRRIAAHPADVEPDPRAAGHRDRTRERHLDRDLIAELEGRRGTGSLDDRRRRAAAYRRWGWSVLRRRAPPSSRRKGLWLRPSGKGSAPGAAVEYACRSRGRRPRTDLPWCAASSRSPGPPNAPAKLGAPRTGQAETRRRRVASGPHLGKHQRSINNECESFVTHCRMFVALS